MVEKSLKNKTVLFVVAYNDYQDIEYKKTKQVIKDAGIKADVCSSSLGTARGKYGGEIKIELLINNVDINEYDAVIFIGGPGAVEYLNSEDAYKICRQVIDKEKILGGICIAPQIFAKAGILKNKQATVFASESDKSGVELYTKEGVKYLSNKDVVIDGNIITACGPDASEDFGKAIVNKISQS